MCSEVTGFDNCSLHGSDGMVYGVNQVMELLDCHACMAGLDIVYIRIYPDIIMFLIARLFQFRFHPNFKY